MAEPDSTSETLSQTPLPAGKDHHAFICFNSADQDWVDDTIPYLESPEIGLKCVDHRRDFHAGKTTIKNIEEFIEKSWKYVLVMTPDFVDSDWCSFETDIMVGMSLEQREECIVPVLLKPCIIPKALKSLTYIEVDQSDKWKEKLVRDVRRDTRRADITSRKSMKSKLEMQKKSQMARKNISAYKQCIDNNMKEKKQLELERKSLANDAHNAFSILTKRLLDELEKQKTLKINDIHEYMDRRLTTLIEQKDTAKEILASVNKDLDDKALNNFTCLLDEYEELERRQRETSYTEFVMSDCLVEKLFGLMSEFDIGHLREMDVTQIKTQKDRDNFLKEISPSWAVLPKTGDLTPWSVVRCPHFQFDPRTVHADRSILPDGFLYNKPPSRPHPPSDRRLKKYLGAVGTATLSLGGIFYWQNHVDVDLEKVMEGKNLVFEVGLSMLGVIDERHSITMLPGTISMYANRCTHHSTDVVCLKIYKDTELTHHHTLHPNRSGNWSPLVLGFLLDTLRNRWTIYDVTKQKEITTVEKIGDVEEFTPMFGVYNPTSANIKLSLITGTDLKLSDCMYRLIRRALESNVE